MILSNGGGDAAAISFPENGNVVERWFAIPMRTARASTSLPAAVRYENNGTGQFDPRQDPGGTYAADLDGDGDLDVLTGSGWYENNGTGGFGGMQAIGSESEWSQDLHAADLDGDGDLDVLTGSGWYENNGTGGFGSMRTIATSSEWVDSLYAADLDGDGDFDVLTGNGWYENNGTGGFGPMRTIGDRMVSKHPCGGSGRRRRF